MQALPRNSYLFLLLNLAAISAFGPFITDFYLPVLPSMEGVFRATTTQIQLTITCSLIGLALGQLIIGPLSDKFGRKPILLVSFAAFIASTIGCLLSSEIYPFIAFRLIQGIAGSGGVVVARSIVADLFKGEDLAKFFAMLGAIHGLAPVCAPILGGVMLKFTDWHGVFVILLGIGIALLIANLFFKESLPPNKRTQGSLWQSFRYSQILKNRAFMNCVLAQSFAMGALFSFIASSSFIYQKHFGVSELAYSMLFAGVAIGTAFGAGITPLIKSRRRALKVGIVGLTAMGVVLFALLNLKVHFLLLEAGFFLTMACLGLIMPTSTALAMEMERENAGSASATLGFGVFFIGGIASPLTGLGGDIFRSTSLVIAFCVVCAVIFSIRVIRATK